MSLKRSRNDSEPNSIETQQSTNLFESSPISDRASKFIALFSPDTPPKILQAHPPYKPASHRILAWRKPSKQQSLLPSPNAPGKLLYDTGHDDDGEKYAGRKLVNLLVDMNVSGAIVVARWYGGVMLGPARFDHIVNVAKEAIAKWKEANGEGAAVKKMKVEEASVLTAEQEAEQKERLVKQLGDRDTSIKVLRELLAEKKSVPSPRAEQVSATQTLSSPPSKTVAGPNYSVMPLKTLKQLEKARDTTISWILKQIEEAETANTKKDSEGP